MALIIREATGDDMPGLVRLGKQFAEVSPYAPYYDEMQLISAVYRLLSMETACCFVAQDGNHIVGFIYGISSTLWFNQFVPYVAELAWWVDPKHRGTAGPRLLKQLEQWASERGAVILSLSQLDTLGTDLQPMMSRRGYTKAESTYYKKLKPWLR